MATEEHTCKVSEGIGYPGACECEKEKVFTYFNGFSAALHSHIAEQSEAEEACEDINRRGK